MGYLCLCETSLSHPVMMDLDLDGFGVVSGVVDDRSDTATGFEDARSALLHIDHWYRERNRRGRQMDLIGDYAGTEPFVLDGNGHSLIRNSKMTDCGCRGGHTSRDSR